jgi:hypothetical protein
MGLRRAGKAATAGTLARMILGQTSAAVVC